MLKSMGLNRGIADCVWFPNGGKVVWLEFKINSKDQSPEQERFQKIVTGLGHVYEVMWDEDDFWIVINKYI